MAKDPKCVISQDRINLLEDAGFVFDVKHFNWLERFRELKSFIDRYGSVDEIPKTTTFSGKLTQAQKDCNSMILWVKVRQRFCAGSSQLGWNSFSPSPPFESTETKTGVPDLHSWGGRKFGQQEGRALGFRWVHMVRSIGSTFQSER